MAVTIVANLLHLHELLACSPHHIGGSEMTDGRDSAPDTGESQQNDLSNKLDSLLPSPGDKEEVAAQHDQVDGPLDEVLPLPGRPSASDDDASTREELEVDTSADGVDDFIPLYGADSEAPETATKSDGNSTCIICGEPISGTRFCPTCGTEQVPASLAISKLAPLFMWSRPLAIRVTLSFGALLTLLALLADSGTTALIIGASTLPIVILIRLSEQLGGMSRNELGQAGMMVLVGVTAGLPIAWLSTSMVSRSWFDTGVVNFGATNFGGVAVETVGNAPLIVWVTSGILFPLIMIIVIGSAPAALRMALAMPPHEATGMMLSAAVASGYMIGAAIVFYRPLYYEIPPIMSTSEWTLTIAGIAVIHPIVWVYSSAVLGAVVWRNLGDSSVSGVAVPASIAVCLPLAFAVAGLALGPRGLWMSTVFGIVLAGFAVWLHARFLNTAVLREHRTGL